MIIFFLLYFAVIVGLLVAMWKIFEKAGRPGWESLIPIYGAYILITEIVKKEWWWLLLCLIPFVNIIAMIFICIALAKSFGRDTGIGILCLFAIGIFILGFGPDKYLGAPEKDEADRFLGNLGNNNG